MGVVMLDSICMQFIAIGESLKGLDKVTKGMLLPTHPEIDWKNVKGLRDIIAHHYFEVDADQIWWIIEKELMPLKKNESGFRDDGFSEMKFSQSGEISCLKRQPCGCCFQRIACCRFQRQICLCGLSVPCF